MNKNSTMKVFLQNVFLQMLRSAIKLKYWFFFSCFAYRSKYISLFCNISVQRVSVEYYSIKMSHFQNAKYHSEMGFCTICQKISLANRECDVIVLFLTALQYSLALQLLSCLVPLFWLAKRFFDRKCFDGKKQLKCEK